MKPNLLIAYLILLAPFLAFAQKQDAQSIDDLIREASNREVGDWKDLRDFESWKIERFLKRTLLFSNSIRFDFQATHGSEVSIFVEVDGRWPPSTLSSPQNRFFVVFEDKYYPFLPGSTEERAVRRVLATTPAILRLKRSRRYEHVQSLLEAFEPRTHTAPKPTG